MQGLHQSQPPWRIIAPANEVQLCLVRSCACTTSRLGIRGCDVSAFSVSACHLSRCSSWRVCSLRAHSLARARWTFTSCSQHTFKHSAEKAVVVHLVSCASRRAMEAESCPRRSQQLLGRATESWIWFYDRPPDRQSLCDQGSRGPTFTAGGEATGHHSTSPAPLSRSVHDSAAVFSNLSKSRLKCCIAVNYEVPIIHADLEENSLWGGCAGGLSDPCRVRVIR